MIGVYQITCRSNGRRYIGSAFNIATRWSAHRRDLRARRHCNPKLQSSWNKYGEADFTFETLLECHEEERLQKEQFFLDFFRAVETGFNICTIAGSRRGVPQPAHLAKRLATRAIGRKHSPEAIARMRVAQSNRSPEWRKRGADAKRKINGAVRKPGTRCKPSAATLELMRTAQRRRFSSEEERKKSSDRAKIFMNAPEVRNKLSVAARARAEREKQGQT